MEKCKDGDDCIPLCDFCYYYDFNPNKGGGYQELGYCRKHFEGKDPCERCNDFICFTIKQKEPVRCLHMPDDKKAVKGNNG